MPDLDAVTQRFIADTTQYVAAVKAAAQAAKDFAETNGLLLSAIKAVQEEMGGTTESALALTTAEDRLTQSMMEKSAAAMIQSGRLGDLRTEMGFVYIASELLGISEAGLARTLALTAGVTDLVVRADADLVIHSVLAAQAIDAQRAALTGVGTQLALTSGAAGKLGQAEYDLITAMIEKTGAASRQGGQLHDLAADMAGTAAATGALSGAEERLAIAAAASAVSQTASASMMGLAAQKAANSTKTGTGIMIGWWRLSANAIHWIIAGTAEYLAVAIPGSIALAAGAFVLYQGVVEDVTRRMQAMYGATEATAAMIGKTTGDVLGMGHAFQTAQNQANPIAYELLGEYLNAARANAVNFAHAGLQVAQAVGELGAKIAVDLNTHASEFQGLLSKMVPDLIEFGQILGNIGHAILNFASDMPGLAEVLLKIADAISKVILWISELPHWLVLSFMAMEEFQRWGGLVSTGLGRMGLALGDTSGKWYTFGHAAGIIKSVLGVIPTLLFNAGSALSLFGGKIPVIGAEAEKAGGALARFGGSVGTAIAGMSTGTTLVVAGLAIGVGILIDKLVTAKTDAQAFGDSLEKNIAKSSNVNVVNTLAQSVGELNMKIIQANASAKAAPEGWRGVGVAYDWAQQAAGQLTQTQSKMIGQFASVTVGADKISGAYGTTFAQSLAIADMAGVKLASTEVTLGKNANVAGMQIQSMVDGYARLNQVGGTLGTDMNALAIQAGLAGTKVSQLNSALDQFVSNGTSMTSSLASLNQDLTQIGNTGVEVGKKFETFSGTTKLSIDKAALSLQSFSGTGAQTWQNYDAALQQAQQYTDALRVASAYGGVSLHNFRGSIADVVQSLLPFTTHSKEAVSELSMIAQEAGGPATSSYKQLDAWAKANGISTKEFNKALQDETAQLTNAGAAAQEFASTLQSQMQQQMAAALLSTQNINGAVGQFQTAVQKAGGQISTSSGAYKHLYDILVADGLSAKQAKNELQMLQHTINGMHGTNIPIHVNTVYTQSGTPPSFGGPGTKPPGGGQHGMTVGFAGGGMVGGPSGVDAVHAMLSAGEAVLTARAVAAIGGPLSVHTLNTQPSSAVLTGAGAGGGSTALGLNLTVNNKMEGQTVNSVQRRETLIYNRRNPKNNLSLRAR